jgi:hypothetical protein
MESATGTAMAGYCRRITSAPMSMSTSAVLSLFLDPDFFLSCTGGLITAVYTNTYHPDPDFGIVAQLYRDAYQSNPSTLGVRYTWRVPSVYATSWMTQQMHVVVRKNAQAVYSAADLTATNALEAALYPMGVSNPSTWYGASVTAPFIERASLEAYEYGYCSLNDTASLQLIDAASALLNVQFQGGDGELAGETWANGVSSGGSQEPSILLTATFYARNLGQLGAWAAGCMMIDLTGNGRPGLMVTSAALSSSPQRVPGDAFSQLDSLAAGQQSIVTLAVKHALIQDSVVIPSTGHSAPGAWIMSVRISQSHLPYACQLVNGTGATATYTCAFGLR